LLLSEVNSNTELFHVVYRDFAISIGLNLVIVTAVKLTGHKNQTNY